MYSRNDYRYYLENRLMHSDDFLAHYGVKGMKWHKKKAYDESQYSNSEMTITSDIGDTRFQTKYARYGRAQKRADMRADRKQLHQHVNETNPYKYDKKKSVSKNLKNNIRIAKDRKQLKKIADSKVDTYYNVGKQPEDKLVKVSETKRKIGMGGNGKTSLSKKKKKKK